MTDPQPFIILDRDGVINEDSDNYIRSPEEWIPIPGSIQAISDLSNAGFRVVVVTNQSGIGRGFFDEYTLGLMHEKLHQLVEDRGGSIAGIFLCPHLPDEDCGCRKPATGMLDRIEAEFGSVVSGCWFIGDSAKDLDCALARGCRPGLVLTGKGRATHAELDENRLATTTVFADLRAAADYILNRENSK